MEQPRFTDYQDQYKFPMGQLIYERVPDAEVTFRLTNRKADTMPLATYIRPEELQERYDELRQTLRITPQEVDVLRQQEGKHYSEDFLRYVQDMRLPEIAVSLDPTTHDLTAETSGRWNDVSLWEIPMLATLPELYYPRRLRALGLTMSEVQREGDRRLSETIALLRDNPQVKFAEFGTRRRFSSEWQRHVVERLATECPENFLGTSNPHLAAEYNVPAVGTNAHELAMVYAALEDARGGAAVDGQTQAIDDWLERFPSMPVALTDTFTTDFTLSAMTPEQYEAVQSYRIDSGDERVVGRRIIQELGRRGIDPMTRTLFFSNSLTPKKAVELADYFDGRIGVAFGIGGNLVNDLGQPGMNVVAKAVAVNGHGTVKLSDDAGKHMGSPKDIARYQAQVRQSLTMAA
ncbi:MAG: nicotinate phosphoribosyltransferase [Candidatus Saccharibacteria bacterium]|nr:nicotinate phosphoribosyltransferase [Candidatus Saccharibacteria bacterium]